MHNEDLEVETLDKTTIAMMDRTSPYDIALAVRLPYVCSYSPMPRLLDSICLIRHYNTGLTGLLGGWPIRISPPNCICVCLFLWDAARCLALAREELGALRRRAGLPRSPLRGTLHAASDISGIGTT